MRPLLGMLAPLLALVVLACRGDGGAHPTLTRTAVVLTSTPTATPTAAATRAPTATAAAPSPTSTSPAPTSVPPTATPVPATGPAAVLSRGPATSRTVALTFDAGADRGFAGLILDTLLREGVPAGFGMTGKWAEQNPDLVERMVREGHLLINHTYDHASFTGTSTDGRALTQAQRWSELDRLELIVVGLTGRSTKPFFRPPYGDYDAWVNRDAGARGYAYNVMWTVDSRGWMGLSAADIVTRCLELAVPGAIYVFHVGAASADAQALPQIIAGLRANGYTFARLSDYVQ